VNSRHFRWLGDTTTADIARMAARVGADAAMSTSSRTWGDQLSHAVDAGTLTHSRLVARVGHVASYCHPGKIAANPWVVNSNAIAAMSNPMIWVKIRIPVGPISDAMTSASLRMIKVLTATATMMAQINK
jgi:hypothetical protein